MLLRSLFRMERPTARKAANALLVLFYLVSVALWFKDSFSFLKAVPLPHWAGIVPLLFLAVLRFALRERREKRRLFRLDRRDAAVLILIVVAATLVRIPFLTHGFGLMNSDEAIPALSAKHIAEGGRPALYYYGAFFQGSLPQHFSALLFGLFGYSVFLAKLSAFIVYLVFICVHYGLLRKIFGVLPAAAISAFFVPPLPDLVIAGFDIGSGFPFVLLFVSLIFLLTHAIVFERDDRPIPLLGFLMGLSFWTHQISVIFIGTSILFLLPALKLRWKKYGALVFFSAVGAFPLILNEIYRKFVLAKFLLPVGPGEMDPLPIGSYKDLVLSLLVSDSGPTAWIVIILLLAGSAGLVVLSLKNGKLRPSLLFVAYAALFSVVYILSDFGRTGVIRYMYVLYPAFPVLFAGVFLPLGKRTGAPVLAAFFILLFFAGNGSSHRDFVSNVKAKHVFLSNAVAAMEETGERYWLAEYWTSYLLTAISKERLVVASSTVRRYYPYKLFYDSGDNSNWVINRDTPAEEIKARDLIDLLDSLGVPYGFREVGTMALFFRIGSYLYPRFPMADPQEAWPDIRLEKTRVADGLLELLFVRENDAPTGGYRIHVEIPGYFSRFFALPPGDRFTLAVPYPEQPEFSIRRRLAYAGLDIPDTLRETACVLTKEELRRPRNAVVFLAGVGPRKEIEGRGMHALQKNASFEIQVGAGPETRLAFHLHSPFQFDNPFWYGNYRQEVSILVNGVLIGDKALRDGDNVLRLDIVRPPFRAGRNRIDFEFRYAMVFSIYDLWKTATHLERIAFE